MKAFPLSTKPAVALMPPPLAFRITSGSVTSEFRPTIPGRRPPVVPHAFQFPAVP